MSSSATDFLSRLIDVPVANRLAAAIDLMGQAFPTRTAIVEQAGSDQRRTIAYGLLAANVKAVEQQLSAQRPRGVVARQREIDALVATVAACGRQQVPLAVVADDARDLVGALQDWAVLDDGLKLSAGPTKIGSQAEHRREEAFDPASAQVVVATSGTSGPPKLVEHSWDSLLAAARLSEQWHGLSWLLVYDATRWAGTQVWLQALLTAGTLVVPASRAPDCVARAIVEEDVSILPATPTLLRRLLTSAESGLLSKMKLERITLGGEATDAQLLAKTQAAFPGVKVTHVYATTELGEVFRVTDGRAGFPAEWLGKTLPGGVRLTTRRDGELLVQLSRDTAEVATGDLVERRNDRCEFTGRRSDVIVVGGAKVYPRRVEDILRGVSGIADARVYGLPSAITGELVAAQIVLADPLPAEVTPESIRAAALTTCRTALEPHSTPRLLDFVKHLMVNTSGKIPRHSGRL